VDFSVFADLDEAGVRREKIGIVEIPEIGFVFTVYSAEKNFQWHKTEGIEQDCPFEILPVIF